MAGLDGHLQGRAALITGAGSGIGRATAIRLAREGAQILVSDIVAQGAEETVDLIGQFGGQARAVIGNVASEQDMADAAAACVDAFGRLDVMVANAGIGRGGPLLEMTLEQFQRQLDVNVTGVFLSVQAAARQMVRLGNGGRIVCIASLAAENTGPMIWSYSATKVAVRMMVRGWAQELGVHGINVNAIGPGVIETPLAAGLAGTPGGIIRENLEATTPVGRVGQPEDVAGLVNFLASPDAAFMTGDYLLIDGGLRDARQRPEPQGEHLQEVMEHMGSSMQRNAQLDALMGSGD